MLWPFPGQNVPTEKAIFSYRLRHARHVIEIHLESLQLGKFSCYRCKYNYCENIYSDGRLFRRPIIADSNNVVMLTEGVIALHNYPRMEESVVYSPTGYTDGEAGSGNLFQAHGGMKNPPHDYYLFVLPAATSVIYILVCVPLLILIPMLTFQLSMKIYQNSCRCEESVHRLLLQFQLVKWAGKMLISMEQVKVILVPYLYSRCCVQIVAALE